MYFLNQRISVFGVLAALSICLNPAIAQTKPPESSSKVKKVLLYNKIGGWVGATGTEEVKSAFSNLSEAKGFELVQTANETLITLDYLKQFQVVVWNNNSNAAASVTGTAARQAFLDYLDQGGGWMLIHNAADHGNTWPALAATIGTGFNLTGKNGQAEVVLDSEGRNHRELKWMVEGFPEAFRLEDRWLSFTNTVRPLPGVTVVATSRAIAETSNVILQTPDGSGDNTYLWARQVGKGRLFYNAIGFGNYGLMEQQDSIVPRLYWENLRYLAGDYQNGCANPANLNFDPAVRVHDDGLCMVTGLNDATDRNALVVSKGALGLRFPSPHGKLRVRLHDLRGSLVMDRILPAGTHEITLDAALRPGVYHFEVRGDGGGFQRRLALP